MNFANNIQLQKIVLANGESTQVFLMVDNKNIGLKLDGQYLEAAIALENKHYLLFVTHDIPLEETLDIVLVDVESKQLIDSLWIGLMYETGVFETIKIVDDYVEFEFLRIKPWKLKVLETSEYRFPFALDAMLHRPFGFTTQLKIN